MNAGRRGMCRSRNRRPPCPVSAHRMAGWLAAMALAVMWTAVPAIADSDEAAAVVIMYHRFGEPDHPSTNVSLEQFDAHLAELSSGRYAVLPLPEIVDGIRRGRALPDRAVGITIDDAYLSVYTEAWPRLRAAGLPFTVFVATDPVDRQFTSHMSWDQIRELVAAGVTIGSQTATHLHMIDASDERNRVDIETSNRRFEEELGGVPTLIAYPYGEAGMTEQAMARSLGFHAGFGQHSGVIGSERNRYYLPRFAMNESYGDMDRFTLAVNALPLPVKDLLPADTRIEGTNPPPIGFTVDPDVTRLSGLACYASHEGKVRIERLGERRIEVRLSQPFRAGRNRLNCTMPAGDGRWRWFGRQFYVPRPG